METLYEVAHKESNSNNYLTRLIPESKPIFAVSVRNLVAFTTHTDVSRQLNQKSSSSVDHSGCYVHVADLNTPWDCYLIKNSSSQITSLNWDHTGVRLLVANQDGQLEVYAMLEYLLNKWHLVLSTYFRGEPIISSLWLNAPRKVCLIPDKLDSILYSEKYSVSLGANGKGFGGRCLDGAIVVTATGLLGVLVSSPEDSTTAISALEKMVAVRHRVMFADLAYAKDGDLVVVSSSDALKHPVQVSRVGVNIVGPCRDKAEIVVNGAQSLFIPNNPDHLITAVKFLNKMNPEELLVALKNPESNTSSLALYTLVSEPVSLKARFQTADPIMTYRWQQTCQISFTSTIENFCTLPIPIALPNNSTAITSTNQTQTYIVGMSQVMQPMIAISLSNGIIQLVRSDGFQQVMSTSGKASGDTTNLLIKRENDGPPDAKQLKLALKQITNDAPRPFVSLQFTWSGCLLLCLDSTSQIHVYKVHSGIDASTATSLLELSMMGGLDTWDIMTCLRPNLIDSITDRLSETFARQPPTVQTHYNVRILVVKAALYRLACGGMARTNDQQTLLTLHLVSGALKALLRPSDLSSHDKGPAESLASLLNSKGEALLDVDKVLLNLEAKEYAVEPSLLQSLQQFLQWCADLALKLLATLPDLRHSRAPGWEVCRDSKAIGTLRELIVLMRIWGLIRLSCLPTFRKTSDSLDVLPLIFRLLTRLSITPHEPDEALIDHGVLAENKPIPYYQQMATEKNEEAYIWLYAALGFGIIVFFLILLGMWCQTRKRSSELTTSDDSFLHVVDDKRDSSILDGSLTTSSVQPMSNFDKMSEYPPPSFCSSVVQSGKGMSFGSYNLHHQQPTSPPAPTPQSQNDTLLQTLNERRSSDNAGSSRGSLSQANSMQGRQDSFPYEEYGIPENERIPLRTRVEDQNAFDSYLHLTPAELYRLDSLADQEDDVSPSSLTKTLPISDNVRK